MALSTFFVISAALFLAGIVDADHALPRFSLDLDLPPEERWATIVTRFSKFAPEMRDILIHHFGKPWYSLMLEYLGKPSYQIPDVSIKEMQGIAKVLQWPFEEVFLWNIYIEMESVQTMCTSIVVEDDSGNIIHGRNFDYDQPDVLRKLVITVDFTRRGQVVFTGNTLVGTVGLNTAQKPHAFTISGNSRLIGKMWTNFLALITGKGKLYQIVVRECSDRKETFQEAVQCFLQNNFSSPAYLVIGGVQPGEGVVITRDPFDVVDTLYLNETKEKWFLVETNYDHWKKPPKSDNRREPAIKALREIGRERISLQTLYLALSVNPVLNPTTVYTALMTARRPEMYMATLRTEQKYG